MPEDPVQSEPVGLYQGPRLAAFQGTSLIVVLAAAVSAGVFLHWGAGAARDAWRAAHSVDVDVRVVPPQEQTDPPRARVEWPMTLPGPDGTTVTLSGTAIVHVWLQGCPDCMPAFEAMKKLQARGEFAGARVFNVAYGSADVAWARQYGVDGNLAFDEGSHFVQALGIGTFTTVVVDDAGFVRSQGSPVAQDFAPRVLSVWREMQRAAIAPTNADAHRVAEVVAFLRGHEHELKACGEALTTQTTARVHVSVAADGSLVASSAVSTDGAANGTAACLAEQLAQWSVGSATSAPTDFTVAFSFTPVTSVSR